MKIKLLIEAKRAAKHVLRRAGVHLQALPRDHVSGLSLEFDLPKLITTSSPVIFDVGANVGQSIDLFRSIFPSAKLFSFEPGEDAFTALREKCENEAEVQLFPFALGSKEEHRSFHLYGSLLNSILPMDANPANRFASYRRKNIASIRVMTLESIWRELGSPRIHLLKIDTQGFDLEVLHGSAAVFDAEAIDNVLIEMNFVPMYIGQPTPEAIMRFLAERELRLVGLYEVVRQEDCIAWTTGMFSKAPWRSFPKRL
ncbi:MAG: FkbM family methyltransferase [Methylocystis sp.]